MLGEDDADLVVQVGGAGRSGLGLGEVGPAARLLVEPELLHDVNLAGEEVDAAGAGLHPKHLAEPHS